MFLPGLCLMRIMRMYCNYVMNIFETWMVKGVDFKFKAFKILDTNDDFSFHHYMQSYQCLKVSKLKVTSTSYIA